MNKRRGRTYYLLSFAGLIGSVSSRDLLGFGNTVVCNLSEDVYGPVVRGDDEKLYVRTCWCRPYSNRQVSFCEQSFDSCIVPKDPFVDVKCFNTTRTDTFSRTFWPVTMFWIIASIYCLFCSETGLKVRHYLRHVLCRHSNEDELNRILRNDPEQSSYLYQQYLRRLGNTEDIQQKLKLRTKIFQDQTNNDETDEGKRVGNETTLLTDDTTQSDKETSDTGLSEVEAIAEKNAHPDEETGNVIVDNVDLGFDSLDEEEDDDDNNKCAICLLTIQEGERVGDISCGHLLHVDCLKDWLIRKNTCPLCSCRVAEFCNANV